MLLLKLNADIQKYWVSGLCPLSGILNTRNIQKLALFLSLGEGRETPTLLGPLLGNFR
jgi:hypothetical protein